MRDPFRADPNRRATLTPTARAAKEGPFEMRSDRGDPALSKELKKSCGTGGKVNDGLVELQGDQRERLRALLSTKGWTVKG